MQSTGRPSRLPSARHLMSAAAILLVAACGSSGGTVQESQGGGGAATAKASASVAAGGDTSSPGTLLTACDLVTAADVKAATGKEAAAGELKRQPNTLSPNTTECTYQGDYGRIVVRVDPDVGDRLYSAAKKAARDVKEIAGVGDGAFWTAQNIRLYAVKGNVLVLFTIQAGDTSEAVATDLARRAIARI